MKRIHLMLVAAFFTSLSTVTSAAPIIINFDEDGLGNPITANTPITNQYASLGVYFEGIEDGGPVNINAAPDTDGGIEPSAPNVLTNCSNAAFGCPGNRADILRISFDYPVFGVSLMLNTMSSSPVTFELYDASDALLETVALHSGGSNFIPVNFTANNISRIDGLQPIDMLGWSMDDLTFAIPAPAPLMLLGLGLAGIGFTRRRAQSRLR